MKKSVMKFSCFSLVALLMSSLLVACGDTTDVSTQSKPEKEQSQEVYTNDDNGEEVEAYIVGIDSNENFAIASSLDYTKDDGSSYLVEIVINDSNEVVKTTEFMTSSGSTGIEYNFFYYKNNVKYASKEYFETGSGSAGNFVERVTYYDEKGEPIVTKQRVAPYEEMLTQAPFKVVENVNVDDARAYRALNQQDEFETNFQGFASEGPMRYLIVGANGSDAYYSTMLVQYISPFINNLMNNEKAMLGTPLKVNFEKVKEPSGLTYQMLMGVSREVEEEKKAVQ